MLAADLLRWASQEQQLATINYSDEYETDDEFFCDGLVGNMSAQDSAGDEGRELETSSLSPSPCSQPIPIPYKR
jgi:hypothetical protein